MFIVREQSAYFLHEEYSYNFYRSFSPGPTDLLSSLSTATRDYREQKDLSNRQEVV